MGFKGLTPSSWQLLGTGGRLWQPSMPDPRRPECCTRPTRVWGPQAQGEQLLVEQADKGRVQPGWKWAFKLLRAVG